MFAGMASVPTRERPLVRPAVTALAKEQFDAERLGCIPLGTPAAFTRALW
jgi:diacylglycerol kinase family enzyme